MRIKEPKTKTCWVKVDLLSIKSSIMLTNIDSACRDSMFIDVKEEERKERLHLSAISEG